MTAVTWLFPISALRAARSGGFSDTRNGRGVWLTKGKTIRARTVRPPPANQRLSNPKHSVRASTSWRQRLRECRQRVLTRRYTAATPRIAPKWGRFASPLPRNRLLWSVVLARATSQRWRTVNDRCTSADRTDLAWLRVPQNVQRRLRLEASQNTGSGQKSAALSSSI